MPYKYYNQKTDVSLPLRQVESLFDTSDQWFQLPERLLVHWSWFESDLLNQKEYKTLFFILLSLYPSCILLVFTLVNIYYLLQLLRTVLFPADTNGCYLNLQDPINGHNQRDVIRWQSDRCQHYHHGYKACLRDSSRTYAGSGRCYAGGNQNSKIIQICIDSW